MDFVHGLLVMATAGMLSLPALPASTPTRSRAVAPGPPKASPFSPGQIEAYLSDDGIAYIRPGVKVNLTSITNVAPGQKPVVEIMLTDQFDQPLDRLGKVTPGPIAPAFVLGPSRSSDGAAAARPLSSSFWRA